MTKQHFSAFADRLRADMTETARNGDMFDLERTRSAVNYAAVQFSAVAQQFNPRFNHDKFMAACGLRPGGRV